jgi:hypothetical protein
VIHVPKAATKLQITKLHPKTLPCLVMTESLLICVKPSLSLMGRCSISEDKNM